MRREAGSRAGFAAGALTIVVIGGWLLDRGGDWSPLAGSEPEPVACEARDGWMRDNGERVAQEGRTLIGSNAAVTGCVDGAGVLALRLRGSTVAGHGPRVVVVQGAERLLDVVVPTHERAYVAEIPRAGAVMVAFVNDRREGDEDRNLSILELAFAPSGERSR